MSSRVSFTYVLILLFLLLAVIVDSQTCGLSNYQEDPLKASEGVGRNATEGQWPWMVAIRIRDSSGDFKFWCSGFLIDRRHIISAAQCIEDEDVDLYRANIGNINYNIADEYRIIRIAVHPGYKKGFFYDDIAVLTLDEEVHLKNFNPICLPNEEVSTTDLVGRGTTLSGWATVKFGGDINNNLMYLGQLPVMSNEKCQRNIRKISRESFQLKFRHGITRGIICAAFKEGFKGVCQFLSGAPLMFQSENQWYAIGIMTFGYHCGLPEVLDGFTRISNYIDWIRQNTKD